MNEHLQAARDMLTFHGIDPDSVTQLGISQEGYYAWVEGEKIDSSKDGFGLPFIPWPKSFPVASFFEHYWAWKGAVV